MPCAPVMRDKTRNFNTLTHYMSIGDHASFILEVQQSADMIRDKPSVLHVGFDDLCSDMAYTASVSISSSVRLSLLTLRQSL